MDFPNILKEILNHVNDVNVLSPSWFKSQMRMVSKKNSFFNSVVYTNPIERHMLNS